MYIKLLVLYKDDCLCLNRKDWCFGLRHIKQHISCTVLQKMCSHGGCLITLLLVWGTSRHAFDTERTPRTNYISMAELSQILLLFYHFHPVHALRYLFEQVYSRNSLFGSQRDQACYFDITECTSYPRCIIVKLTKCYYRCVILGD